MMYKVIRNYGDIDLATNAHHLKNVGKILKRHAGLYQETDKILNVGDIVYGKFDSNLIKDSGNSLFELEAV